jgi:Domain of unknown function (DUF4760)
VSFTTILNWLTSGPMTAQVWATIFIGFLASCVAYWGVSTQRLLARRKTTFDHLVKSEFDRDMINATLVFVKQAKTAGGLRQWAAVDKRSTEEGRSIRMVLNEMEIISIGLQHGIIDAEMYSKWSRSGVLRKWQFAKEYVDAVRADSNNNALFHEAEELFKLMQQNKLPKRNFSFRKFW